MSRDGSSVRRRAAGTGLVLVTIVAALAGVAWLAGRPEASGAGRTRRSAGGDAAEVTSATTSADRPGKVRRVPIRRVSRSAPWAREDVARPAPVSRPPGVDDVLALFAEAQETDLALLSERLERALALAPTRAADVARAFTGESRGDALFALARALAPCLGAEPARGIMLAALDRGDAPHRECAIMAFLGDAGRDATARLCPAFASDESPAVREAAATALATVAARLAPVELEAAKLVARRWAVEGETAELRMASLDVIAAGGLDPADAEAASAALAGSADRATRLYAARLLSSTPAGAAELRRGAAELGLGAGLALPR